MNLINEEGQALHSTALEDRQIAALSAERLGILRRLARRPMYAAELAREMRMEGQALHYHLKLLQKAGLLKLTEYEERRGGMARKYTARSESLALVLHETGWKPLAPAGRPAPPLFRPFIEHQAFHGKFVVGSPDPHGPYRARGSEFALFELTMLLGSFATFSFPLYILDTQIQEADKRQNLVVAGGPKVNMLTAELNSWLPIRFDARTFELYSSFSKKHYSGNIGVVELVGNPFARGKKVLFIGGLNHHGTRAAVLAILKKMKGLEQGNAHSPRIMAKVVEGFDENGDGTVDTVEILE